MKRLFFGLATLACVSCSVPTLDGDGHFLDSHPIFHATIEEASRVYLDENVHLHWTAGDMISLYEGTTRNKQYIFKGETGDRVGEFEYVKTDFGSGYNVDRYYAIYPYASTNKLDQDGGITYMFPDTQHYVNGSVDPDSNVMVAVTANLDDFDLTFRNVGSYILIKLYGTDQTVGSITVSTIGGESLAGKSHITPTYGGEPTITMVDNTPTVTLNCGDGVAVGTTKEQATLFWVVIPPITASEGIVVTVNDLFGRSQSYEVTTPTDFKRNKYKVLTRELAIDAPNSGLDIGGFDPDNNWDSFVTIPGLAVTVIGYGEDYSWDTDAESSGDMSYKGFLDDSNWDTDAESSGDMSYNGYGDDKDLDSQSNSSGDVSYQGFTDDQNWDN